MTKNKFFSREAVCLSLRAQALEVLAQSKRSLNNRDVNLWKIVAQDLFLYHLKSIPDVYMKDHGLNDMHRHFLSSLKNPKDSKVHHFINLFRSLRLSYLPSLDLKYFIYKIGIIITLTPLGKFGKTLSTQWFFGKIGWYFYCQLLLFSITLLWFCTKDQKQK